MILRKMAMTAATATEVFHPDFLGAHRYTTASGGIVRPAGSFLNVHVGPIFSVISGLLRPRGPSRIVCWRNDRE